MSALVVANLATLDAFDQCRERFVALFAAERGTKIIQTELLDLGKVLTDLGGGLDPLFGGPARTVLVTTAEAREYVQEFLA